MIKMYGKATTFSLKFVKKKNQNVGAQANPQTGHIFLVVPFALTSETYKAVKVAALQT